MADELAKLEPCPFCGAHLPHMWSLTMDGVRHTINCTECPGRAEFHSSSREQAIAAWNRRAAPIAAQLDQDAERVAFEKHYGPKDSFAWRNADGSYKVSSLQLAWEIWRAARAAPAAAQLDAELPPLTDEQIIAIRNKVGERYNSAAHVSASGAIEFARTIEQEVRAPYAERIRLLDHEVITQKLAAQVLRDRVSFLESERNLMEANRRAYIDGRTAAPTPELRQAAHALIAAFDDPKCSIASVNNYVRDLERALGRTAGTASDQEGA